MGFRLLLETAGIMDLIMNCMALSFVLQVDELVQGCFGSCASEYILDEIDGVMCKGDKVYLSRDELGKDDDVALIKVCEEAESECDRRQTFATIAASLGVVIP